MYVVTYNSDSINVRTQKLAYFNIFPEKEHIESSMDIIFADTIMVNTMNLEEAEVIKNRLENRGYLKNDFSLLKSDRTKLEKAFKHVMLWKIIHSDYFGSNSTKEIVEQMVDADQDMFEFLGDSGHAFINSFSQSAKNIEIMGYAHKIREFLDPEIIETWLDFGFSIVDLVHGYFKENPELNTATEPILDSWERLKIDMLSKEDFFDNYNLAFPQH